MIDRIQLGQWLSENLGYGRGSLQVRGTAAGGRYYLRVGRERCRYPLGVAKGRGALTLDQARQRAWTLAVAGSRGAASGRCLGNLLTAFCDTLAQAGRASHKSTLALFYRHLRAPHPQLWMQSARTVTAHQIVEVLVRLVAEDKLATARKLRADLNAAFNRASRADLCARSSLMRGFGLTHNPVGLIAPISPAKQGPERVLTIEELRSLWSGLDALDTPAGAILRFYLLTGGQRLAQLLRARSDDLVAGGMLLYDPKGRRSTPRQHLVPVIDAARRALNAIPGGEPHLLTLKAGGPPPHPATLFRHLQSVTGQLVSEGRVRKGINFAALRRTVETQLAGAGIPAVVRAHLQSHDLGGIQARHYDRYGYHEEKREALDTWFKLLTMF